MSDSSIKLPTRFVRVGDTLNRYGVELMCVERPSAGVLSPSDACLGCWFFHACRIRSSAVNCSDIQCSCWDRRDGIDVWFKLVK